MNMNSQGMQVVDFGESTKDMKDYLHVTIEWREPVKWFNINNLDDDYFEKGSFIYVITQEHGNRVKSDTIVYIGITERGLARGFNEKHSSKFKKTNGTYITFGFLISDQKTKLRNQGRSALEELEHILIWALWSEHELWNELKIQSLPGWGVNGTQAWHIKNQGYEFAGRMPEEIIYPWMVVKFKS
ncbi:MAG: hypothetical protein COA60_002920 [Robiginitomaculum sp.]|nr:hypothetical protein [Robiginitomaculum sp.]